MAVFTSSRLSPVPLNDNFPTMNVGIHGDPCIKSGVEEDLALLGWATYRRPSRTGHKKLFCHSGVSDTTMQDFVLSRITQLLKFRLFYKGLSYHFKLFGNKGIFQRQVDNLSSQGGFPNIRNERFGRFFPHVRSFFSLFGRAKIGVEGKNWGSPPPSISCPPPIFA